MIEGLYVHNFKRIRLHQLGKKIWGNINTKNNPRITKAEAKTEERLRELGWVKAGGKVMVMWDV